MQEIPLISVIVPIYNSEQYLSKCILSIIDQSYQNLEIILIDDGSKDNSLCIAQFYAVKDKRIQVYQKKNGGVSSARNLGLEHCSGDYITFIDSDDWYETDAIRFMYETLHHTKADLIFAPNFYINEDQKQSPGSHISSVMPMMLRDYLMLDRPYSLDFTLYSKHLIVKQRLNTQLHFHEDTEFQCRVLKDVPQIGFCDFYGYHYRQGSITHSRFTSKTLSVFKTAKIMQEELKDISPIIVQALTVRITKFIIAVAYIAAKDCSHNKNLDKQLKESTRQYASAIYKSKIIAYKQKLKIALLSISPQIAYIFLR